MFSPKHQHKFKVGEDERVKALSGRDLERSMPLEREIGKSRSGEEAKSV